MKNLLPIALLSTAALLCIGDAIGQAEEKTSGAEAAELKQAHSKITADHAELRVALKIAAIIENDLVRLAAYDKIMQDFHLAPATRSLKTDSKWIVSEKSNPIDDSKTTVMRLSANETVGGGFRKSRPSLVIRRMQGEIELYLTTDMFLGSDWIMVTTRVDKKKAVTRSWGLSTDHKAVFCRTSTKFLSELVAAKKLVVRLTPYSNSPILFTFDLAGLAELMPKLDETLGKKVAPLPEKK